MTNGTALLFDLDGTLTDTDHLHLEAFRILLEDFGRAITPEHYKARIMGHPNDQIMREMFPDETPERRIALLIDATLSGLPPFLTVKTGLNSGFMIAQVTAAALVVESRILCHPACVDSIPSSAGREDHVSMGMTAALKARSVVDHVSTVLAIEVLVAAQALDLRKPLLAGRGVQRAYELVRAHVPSMVEDRELHKDMATVAGLVSSGELLRAARG